MAQYIPCARTIRRFWSDRSGIVTVQMVMFTIMLFSGIGLMMDFGRAYSAHSQMQSYVDQVALAAAAQLDGKPDAIARASAAANSVAKSSNFTSSGAFKLSALTFMSEAPTGSDGAYDGDLAAASATTTSEIARYVLAEATSASVALKLLNFATKPDSGLTSIDFTAAAVAGVRTVACGGLTPLVMCNPYEDSATTSWAAEMENGIGYRMKLTADQTAGGKPSNFTGTNDLIRLGLLKSPADLMEVRNTICNTNTFLPGFTTSSQSVEELRDLCMLATVQTGLSCLNTSVAYKAAPPDTVTTGLGVIFDMYDGAMEDILDTANDPIVTHDFPPEYGLPNPISRSAMFYPDRVPGHGRMTREDYMIHLDDRQAELDASPAPPFLKFGAQNAINAERAAYAPSGAISDASRQNHVFDTGERSNWGPAPDRACLTAENCSGYDTIHAQHPGANEIDAFAAALYRPYLLQQIAAGSGQDWWEVAPGQVDASTLTGGRDTYYGFYTEVERPSVALHVEDATEGHNGRDTLGNPLVPLDAADNPWGFGAYGIQSSARNYSAAYGASAIGDDERRLRRVTVVNCEAAKTYAEATGESPSGYSDTYVGEIVDVVDLLLLTPPMVRSCQTAPASDPQGNNLCPNDEITHTELDVELVDAASINQANFDARVYAVLLH